MKPGRNDPCPCGSGKKYKKCHLDHWPQGMPPPEKYPAPPSLDPSVQFAGSLKIQQLYHYQDFDVNSPHNHAARLLDILQKHRIYCSNPADFNDPWDCKPFFDPALLDDPVHARAAAEALISTRTGGSELDHIDAQLRRNPSFLKSVFPKFSADISQFITERWGVYCLTPDPCSTLMWSHYSRNHKGICLEFTAHDNKFALATKILYQKDYPPFLLHDPNSTNIMLIVKSDDWKYEDEFRLICPRFSDVRGLPLMMDGDYLNIGPDDLTAIILGCQIDDNSEKEIEQMVSAHAPKVKVQRAVRAPNRYRLEIR
ncbi:MAG TPA: SEC-C metal-binding domain-containing protein [Bryobacteraceae bacterium]|jgi:hypothetical protein|nr:SEC-C metal-binding domain-containing protein [Bryobacteraceae bacterium]